VEGAGAVSMTRQSQRKVLFPKALCGALQAATPNIHTRSVTEKRTQSWQGLPDNCCVCATTQAPTREAELARTSEPLHRCQTTDSEPSRAAASLLRASIVREARSAQKERSKSLAGVR
jgi:hypothetical protein